MVELVCNYCNNNYYKRQRGSKFCTSECYGKSKIGEKHSWGNKISKALKGKPKSAEHRRNVANARRGKSCFNIRNEKNPSWKGDMAGYCSIHDWVRLRFKSPPNCTECGAENKKILRTDGVLISYLHLANLSGLYKRDVTDWTYLCPRCHSALDIGRDSISKIFTIQGRKPPC